MTRILLVVLFIFTSLMVNAQFNKNDILLGGQLYYGYNSTNQNYGPGQTSDYKGTYGNVSINLGKALNINTVAGITLSYLPFSNNNYFVDGAIPTKYNDNEYAVG